MDTVSSITSTGGSVTSSLDSQDVSTKSESHYFLQTLQDVSAKEDSRVELIAKVTGKHQIKYKFKGIFSHSNTARELIFT